MTNKPRPTNAGPERVSKERKWRVSEAALEMYRERLKHKSDCDCFGCKLVLDYIDARAERDKLRKKNDGYTRTINRWQKVAARLDQQLQEKSVTLKELREETIVARECARKQNEHIVKLGHDYYKLQQTMVGDLAKHNTLREGVERACRHHAISAVIYDILIDALTESGNEVNDD